LLAAFLTAVAKVALKEQVFPTDTIELKDMEEIELALEKFLADCKSESMISKYWENLSY